VGFVMLRLACRIASSAGQASPSLDVAMEARDDSSSTVNGTPNIATVAGISLRRQGGDK
jgi:hypothetical protein